MLRTNHSAVGGVHWNGGTERQCGMTEQEQGLLNGLIQRVNGTQLQSKDADAENMLRGALGPNPDALYILCQTVLVQQFALENAQKQLAAARAENEQLKTAQPEKHGGFLGNLFGLGKDDTPQQPAPQTAQPGGYQPVHNPGAPTGYAGYGQAYPPQPGYTQPGYGGPPGYPAQAAYGAGYPPPTYGYGAPQGGFMPGGGGFLSGRHANRGRRGGRRVRLPGHRRQFHGFGGGGRGFEGGGTEVVNNYYGDDRGNGNSFGDRLSAADGDTGAISPDIEDRRGESSGFLGSNDSGNDDAYADSRDDSRSFDDDNTGGGDDNSGAGFDDGGSDFSGGDDGGGGDDSGF